MSLISQKTGYKGGICCWGFDFCFVLIINANISVTDLVISSTKCRLPVKNLTRKYIYEF